MAAQGKHRKLFTVLKAALFCVLACFMICVLSVVLTPSFSEDAENSVRGLYEQPRGSVQVVALGASGVYRAFSSDYLFDQYGIYGHNCGSSNQSTLVSYYLLKEMIRTQGDSISVALLDAKPLIIGKTDSGWGYNAKKVYANMQPSLNKIAFLWDMSQEYESVKFIDQLIPLIEYHSRWSELGDTHTSEGTLDAYASFMHGQNLDWRSYVANASRGRYGKYTDKKNSAITDAIDEEGSFYEDKRDVVNVKYFEKIVDLCQENGIDLVLWKPPSSGWGNDEHDNISQLADQYGVKFLDMSAPSVWNACDLSYDLDFFDDDHANLLGSLKISEYLGNYLRDNCSLKDTSGTTNSAFTENDLPRFEQAVEETRLENSLTIEEYLDALNSDRYVVFVAAKGESAEGLSDEARDKAAKLGFDGLATLKTGCPYVGIRDGGQCLIDEAGKSGEALNELGQYRDGRVIVKETKMQSNAQLEYTVELTSDAGEKSSAASILVWGNEKADNGDGINFVVYDKDTGILVSTASFDTHSGSRRSSDADLVAAIESRRAESGA